MVLQTHYVHVEIYIYKKLKKKVYSGINGEQQQHTYILNQKRGGGNVPIRVQSTKH